jgi:hypothetical protein
MLLAPDHPALCTYHARAEAKAHQVEDRKAAAAELLSGSETFSTPATVNLFLGNLLKQLAQGRIPRRQATAMAYISQLILNSLSVMQRQEKDAQAAKAQAAAHEPQRIVIDMPRPRRRPHLDNDNDDHNNTGVPTDVRKDVRSGGSSDPFFSPASSGAKSTGVTTDVRTDVRTGVRSGGSSDPFFSPASSGAKSTHPSAPSQIEQNVPNPPPPAPNPLAGKVLHHLDEPDPSDHPAPLPTRWGTQVYGRAPRLRHRNWPTGSPRRHRHAPERRLTLNRSIPDFSVILPGRLTPGRKSPRRTAERGGKNSSSGTGTPACAVLACAVLSNRRLLQTKRREF